MGSGALESSVMTSSGPSILRYPAITPPSGWELKEGMMPQSVPHDRLAEHLRRLLEVWALERGAFVARELAFRWVEERPAIGIDPDVSIFLPPPPDALDLRSVRSWVEGHAPPIFAVEVVSETKPRKDYTVTPEKYAASGTPELVIFDPHLAGPALRGGPARFQVWRREQDGAFERVYMGEGPARSSVLDAYFSFDSSTRTLRISNDAAGRDEWRTSEQEKEARIAEKEARIAELEAELRARG